MVTGGIDGACVYCYESMKQEFCIIHERVCRDIKTEKAQEQDWDISMVT